jgi:hypothetical protein
MGASMSIRYTTVYLGPADAASHSVLANARATGGSRVHPKAAQPRIATGCLDDVLSSGGKWE